MKIKCNHQKGVNPRSPCGERLWRNKPNIFCFIEFQSALPVWGATIFFLLKIAHLLFQSALPVWGATFSNKFLWGFEKVSIRAPRVGSDIVCDYSKGSDSSSFNPRSPCGERPLLPLIISSISKFQSALPVWGATCVPHVILGFMPVSIRAPRVGSDKLSNWYYIDPKCFNPRSPCGERLLPPTKQLLHCSFNPRSPCGERLPQRKDSTASPMCFNPRSPCGERPKQLLVLCFLQRFNPRSPCGERLA